MALSIGEIFDTKMTSLEFRHAKDDSTWSHLRRDVDTSTCDVECSDTAKINYSSIRESIAMRFE